MYRLGSIAKRLVRDDAELGYEFGGRYEWIFVLEVHLKALAVKYIRRRHFEVGHSESDYYESMFYSLLRSTKTLGVGTQRK